MARSHAKDTELFLDEFDFSGVVMSISLGMTQSNGEVTAFADTNSTFVEGKPLWTVGANGLWAAASPNYDGEIFTDLTSENRLIGVWPDQADSGNRGFEGRSNITRSPQVSDFGAGIGLDVEWQGTDQRVYAWSLKREKALTSTANSTAIQVGALAAGQTGVGILRVMSASGSSPTLDVVIASDTASGFPSTTSRITFTQATGVTSERKTVAGAVTDDYWRAQMTLGGGSTEFSMLCAFGIVTT